MQHFDSCDNCGKKVETDCFDTRDETITYYTPALPPAGVIRCTDEFNERLILIAASAITTLCKECISQ